MSHPAKISTTPTLSSLNNKKPHFQSIPGQITNKNFPKKALDIDLHLCVSDTRSVIKGHAHQFQEEEEEDCWIDPSNTSFYNNSTTNHPSDWLNSAFGCATTANKNHNQNLEPALFSFRTDDQTRQNQLLQNPSHPSFYTHVPKTKTETKTKENTPSIEEATTTPSSQDTRVVNCIPDPDPETINATHIVDNIQLLDHFSASALGYSLLFNLPANLGSWSEFIRMISIRPTPGVYETPHQLQSGNLPFSLNSVLPECHVLSDSQLPILVLDIDETLLHAVPRSQIVQKMDHYQSIGPCGFCSFSSFGLQYEFLIIFRPHLREFLLEMKKYYTIVLFTSSIANYAAEICSMLDPSNEIISLCLSRNHCNFINGNYVKNLTRLGKSLSSVVFLDNSITSFAFNPENSILVPNFFEDPRDSVLKDIQPLLKELSTQSDVRHNISTLFPYVSYSCYLMNKFQQL